MNIRVLFLAVLAILAVQCQSKGDKQDANAASEIVSGPEWVWLFDGSTTDHWRDLKAENFPDHGWVVEDGVLTVFGKSEDEPGGHDIITKKMYANFELELEFKIATGGNSGIKYNVVNTFPGKEGSYLGMEYQLIDNEVHPDAELGRDGNRSMASLYDMIPAPENAKINPPGEWNKARILVDGNHVEHWLNDVKLFEFERKSEAFRELVALSKYNKLENFGELPEGHILLQGHGDPVSFRSIRIRSW